MSQKTTALLSEKNEIPIGMHNRFALLVSLFLLCLLIACSSSRVVQSWANPEFQRPSKIMIFGVTTEEAIRRAYEDSLSQALTKEGLAAVPSYDVLHSEGEADKEHVMDVVKRAGADGVFITRLVRLAKRIDTVPSAGPMWGPPFGRFGGFYAPYWPGYYYDSYRVVEREFAFIESNLYKTDNSQLLMSIMTRTEDPYYSNDKVKEVVELIVKEFRKNGALPVAPGG